MHYAMYLSDCTSVIPSEAVRQVFDAFKCAEESHPRPPPIMTRSVPTRSQPSGGAHTGTRPSGGAHTGTRPSNGAP
jgi:hypothetical protein